MVEGLSYLEIAAALVGGYLLGSIPFGVLIMRAAGLGDPRAHFRPQVDGDLVADGVCGVLIAEKLGVTAPTLSEHMRILTDAGLVRAKRIKGWTMYKRDEKTIAAAKKTIRDRV